MATEQSISPRRWFPPVYSFNCFRNFLNTYAQNMKDRDPLFNYSAWARDLGLKATTSITMVLHGQRTCGPQIRQKLESYFGFNDLEKKYFDCLVHMDRFSNDTIIKQLILEELKRITPKASGVALSEEDLQCLDSWFEGALAELSALKNFSEEQLEEVAHWLRSRVQEPQVLHVFSSDKTQ